MLTRLESSMLKPSSWITGAKRLVRTVVRRLPLLRHGNSTPGSQPVETEPPTVTAPHESAPSVEPSPAVGPTFCIHPWTRLKLLPDDACQRSQGLLPIPLRQLQPKPRQRETWRLLGLGRGGTGRSWRCRMVHLLDPMRDVFGSIQPV